MVYCHQYLICHCFATVLYKTAQQVGKVQIAVEWRSEQRNGQKILVDIVEAEMVGRDIALAASCSASRLDSCANNGCNTSLLHSLRPKVLSKFSLGSVFWLGNLSSRTIDKPDGPPNDSRTKGQVFDLFQRTFHRLLGLSNVRVEGGLACFRL